MGEIGADFQRDWVYPRRTCTLEGQPFPAPAVPERWLEAMYGPAWAVPDPAFQFTTADRTVRQLSGWFRGTSTNRAAWERAYSGARGKLPTGKPSPLARKAASYLSSGGTVIDLGAGRGADSLWLARQGLSVRAYDYVPSAAAGRPAAGRRTRASTSTCGCSTSPSGARSSPRAPGWPASTGRG